MPSPDLVVNNCRSKCAWRRSRAGAPGENEPQRHQPAAPRTAAAAQLFVCRGCGSQWTPDQSWTPINADGKVPGDVRAARKK